MGLTTFLFGERHASVPATIADATTMEAELPGGFSAAEKSFGGWSDGGFLPIFGGAMQTASGMRVSQGTALQVSTVYSCVRIRSRDLARCTPQILRDDGKGNKTSVLDHPVAALFVRPNRVQTWFEFAETLHVAFMLRSNAYAVILRDWRGNPVELIPVNPDLVTMMEAPDGSLFYTVARAGMWLAALLANEPISIPSADILHVRDLSFNALSGVPRIGLARDAIGLAMVQEQQASRWAGNGARPAGILQSKKQLTEQAAARLKQQWEAMQSGIQNTGRTAVLEDGVEWKPMAMSSVDMQFYQARLTQVKEIARYFEVPLHKLGENENLPRASIAELNADYVQNVVMSDATRWEQKIAATFGIAAEGLEVKFDERGLLRADLATMINSARAGVLSGLITQNEGRAYIGYGPMDGGDKLLAPVNLAPNGSAIDGVAPDGAGRPPNGLNPGDALPGKGLSASDVTRIASAVTDSLRKTFNPDQPRDEHGRWTGDDDAGAQTDSPKENEAGKEDRAALTHEIKLVVAGVAITAVALMLISIAPESLVVGVVAQQAYQIARTMVANAGVSAATHALRDMGIDMSRAETVMERVGSLIKALDAHDAKIEQRLVPILRAAANYARDTAVAKLKDHHLSDAATTSLTTAIDDARDDYVAKLGTLG